MARIPEIGSVLRMVSGRQIRAARALLGWSQSELADKALISVAALVRLERGDGDSRSSTVAQVEQALAAEGIDFLFPGGKWGEGVRLVRKDG